MPTDATPGSQAALRQANQQRVIEALRSGGTLTQAEIARGTGLSAATVSNIVRDLRALGTIGVRTTAANGRRARAITLLRPPGAVAALAFELDSIEAAVADSGGRIVARERIEYDVAADPERGVRRGAWLAETILAQARLDRSTVSSLVASVPGPVDLATGKIGSTSCMPNWVGFVPGAQLSARLHLPVTVENDANLCALAEHFEGAARGLEHVFYVRLTHGVGAGLIVSGHLVRGAGGTAGEFGHIALDERGQVCRCGNRGCLETLAGAPYLVGMVPQLGPSGVPATLRGIVAGAYQGDPGCRRVVAEAGAALGRGIAMVVTVFNPQLVVIGGELVEAGKLLLDPLHRALELGALSSAVTDLRVVPGEVGDAALRGALRRALAD